MTPLVFAYGAGLLSTVNPCGFALLPAFLAFYLGEREEGGGAITVAHVAQGFAVGLALSVGFAGVFVVAGLLLAAGLRPVLGALPWTAVAIGVVLTGVGAAMIAGRHVGLTVVTGFGHERRRGYGRVVIFGTAYAVASLSCTVAVFLAVVGQALAVSSVARLLGVFLAYGAGAATVLVALTVSAALARGAFARWMRRLLPLAGRVGGALLAASGVYLVAYWLPQVIHPGSLAPQSVARIPERASAILTAFVSAHEGAFALVGALLLVAGATTGVARARRLAAAGDSGPCTSSIVGGGETTAPSPRR